MPSFVDTMNTFIPDHFGISKTEFTIHNILFAVVLRIKCITGTPQTLLEFVIHPDILKLGLVLFLHSIYRKIKNIETLEWRAKYVLGLISLYFNLVGVFIIFFLFLVDFGVDLGVNSTRNRVVIPDNFPADFQETDDICPICIESPEILVLGCRHIICKTCLNMLPYKNCPKCRHPIDTALIKIRTCL